MIKNLFGAKNRGLLFIYIAATAAMLAASSCTTPPAASHPSTDGPSALAADTSAAAISDTAAAAVPEPDGQFNSGIAYTTFTDSRDGQSYRAAETGKLRWMAENLNYKTDNSWCYDEADSNCTAYGRLYDWHAAAGACPSGWRLPDTADWRNLAVTAGGNAAAGRKLMSKFGWSSSGSPANPLGFSALPGGTRSTGAIFGHIGEAAFWWSASEDGSNAYGLRAGMGQESLDRSSINKRIGLSVRCVMVTDSEGNGAAEGGDPG